MTAETTGVRRRVSAAERKDQMVATAVDLARREGVGAVTLARAAEAAGVSKPIAYQHFGTLPGLLRAMYDRIGAEYERAVVQRLTERAEQGADRGALLRELCEVYVDCSLDNGTLHDEVGAALVAAEGSDRSTRVDVADQYTDFVARLFGYDEDRAYRIAVVFLGAADRMCEAVAAGRVGRDDAVDTLDGLFASETSGSVGT